MKILSHSDIDQLKSHLNRGVALGDALPAALGGTETAGGLWRFYSNSWPGLGIAWWNSQSPWRTHWRTFLDESLFSFGEDVFGNQICIGSGADEAFLLNHENAERVSLYVGPVDLLSNVLASGIDWIDFYRDGSLPIARSFGSVPEERHLHWTTPLILGGQVARSNVSTVPREEHLVGHAKLWAQVSVLPPGTSVVPVTQR